MEFEIARIQNGKRGRNAIVIRRKKLDINSVER